MATCKLCNKNKKLCKSHIIPEWFYSNCYNEQHSFIQFNGNETGYNSKRFKGVYEYLLCKSCEEVIQQYEDYGKLLIEKTRLKITSPKDKGLVLKEYDYHKFKLFILSIIWRSSISSRYEYKHVCLGKYEDQIKELLIADSSVTESYFPILLSHLFIGEKPALGVFIEPIRCKMDSYHKSLYRLIIDGFLIIIGIGDFSPKPLAHKNSVTKNIFVVGVEQIHNIPEFVELYNRLEYQGKFEVYKRKHK